MHNGRTLIVVDDSEEVTIDSVDGDIKDDGVGGGGGRRREGGREGRKKNDFS